MAPTRCVGCTGSNYIGKLSSTHGFACEWTPPVHLRSVSEDRCHLNGLAMLDDRPVFATEAAGCDSVDGDGWRDRTADGGMVLDRRPGSRPGGPSAGTTQGMVHDRRERLLQEVRRGGLRRARLASHTDSRSTVARTITRSILARDRRNVSRGADRTWKSCQTRRIE